MACSRYLIEYGASDSSGVAATPLTISITFVEVALVTGSFLFIGQANSTLEAQQHAAQLYTAGTAPNSAFTADIAAVFQTWLASNVTTYVDEVTAALGATTAVVAAVNTLELGLFSSVLVSDVTVLNATVDQNVTSLLSTNSSSASQTYAYNVTLQVAVLTADMLLSVFVDVLNSTDSRRRLLSNSELATAAVQNSMLSLPNHMLVRPHAAILPGKLHFADGLLAEPSHSVATSRHLPFRLPPESTQQGRGLAGKWAAIMQNSGVAQTDGCPASGCGHAAPLNNFPALFHSALHQIMMLHAMGHSRSLQSTTSTSEFPLVSLLTFKVDLLLAAFGSTSGCSTASVTALFYDDEDAPESLDDLCGTDSGTVDLTMNQALLASTNSSIPLLQVCPIPLQLHSGLLHLTCVLPVDKGSYRISSRLCPDLRQSVHPYCTFLIAIMPGIKVCLRGQLPKLKAVAQCLCHAGC